MSGRYLLGPCVINHLGKHATISLRLGRGGDFQSKGGDGDGLDTFIRFTLVPNGNGFGDRDSLLVHLLIPLLSIRICQQPSLIATCAPSNPRPYNNVVFKLENIQAFVGMLNLEFTMFLALTEVTFHGLTGGVDKVFAKPIKEIVRPISRIQIAIGKMHLSWTTASPTAVSSNIDIFVDEVSDPVTVHFVQFPDENMGKKKRFR